MIQIIVTSAVHKTHFFVVFIRRFVTKVNLKLKKLQMKGQKIKEHLFTWGSPNYQKNSLAS